MSATWERAQREHDDGRSVPALHDRAVIIAMIPPLWHKLMTAKVLEWDCDFATDEERGLSASASARSGIPTLRRAGQSH